MPALAKSPQATDVEAGKGSLPTSKMKTKSRYMELQPIGRDLPKWQDFVKSIDALINWCFEPRFEVDGRELSVVELELEPAIDQSDTSWCGRKLRQRAMSSAKIAERNAASKGAANAASN
ncbi:hypothetical protein NADE_005979 [Nannochloris sp. 'desiccata']|nr:hypothetical protein NADE_005979 [Chlorella desiccata (nom. nud.)]